MKKLLIGARFKDGDWVNHDGTPADVLEPAIEVELVGTRGVRICVRDRYEGQSITLMREDLDQLRDFLAKVKTK